MKNLFRHAWSTLIGFFIFCVCLILPLVGWATLSGLIRWVLGRPVVALIERRFLASS